MWPTKYSKGEQVTVRQIIYYNKLSLMTIKNGSPGLLSEYKCLCVYVELDTEQHIHIPDDIQPMDIGTHLEG